MFPVQAKYLLGSGASSRNAFSNVDRLNSPESEVIRRVSNKETGLKLRGGLNFSGTVFSLNRLDRCVSAEQEEDSICGSICKFFLPCSSKLGMGNHVT